jgi:hypothetical protein
MFHESDDGDDETTQDNGFGFSKKTAAPAPAQKVDSPPRDFLNLKKKDTTPTNPPLNHFNFSGEAFDAFEFNIRPTFEPKAASPPRAFLKAKKNDTVRIETQDPFKIETKSNFKFKESRTKRPSSRTSVKVSPRLPE